MKAIYKILVAALLAVSAGACSDLLTEYPQGQLLEEQMTDPSQVDKLLIAAYSAIGNDEINRPLSLWNYGNVRADDAKKGGRDQSDGQPLHFLEVSQGIDPSSWYQNGFWAANYDAISRSNTVIRLLNSLTEDEYPEKNTRLGEARFLRAHIYFIQKITFKMIPYIDENMTPQQAAKVSNVALTNDELWQKIVDDFEFAYQHLPLEQPEVGRANKYAAAAYLAKTYLYKAYRQDDQHNVTELNTAELNKVIELTEFVTSAPGYRLEPDFAYNFLPGEYENGPESLFAVQYSHDDGTKWGRLNFGNALTTPTSGGDFNKPSQNLVNAFRTESGLPPTNPAATNYDEAVHGVDPRLYHTVAIPGKPYKYTNVHFSEDQSRNKAIYGTYSSLKENVDPASDSYKSIGNWFGNSKNQIVLRYADVLLMRAEALIETGSHADALPLINQLRGRAKASTALIDFQSNYDVSLYTDGVNCTWTPDFARRALRMERRLELAMEGGRFFDLVRWGIAAEVLNQYYKDEAAVSPYYASAAFEKNKNEYVPIPEEQIRLSHRLYQQNHGF